MVPGSFESEHGVKGLACTVKANENHLYPMEKGFLSLYRPPIHVRYDDVASVAFDRVTAARGEASRTFDMTVRFCVCVFFFFFNFNRSLFFLFAGGAQEWHVARVQEHRASALQTGWLNVSSLTNAANALLPTNRYFPPAAGVYGREAA